MEYNVLSDTSLEELIGAVNDALRDGWKLQGSIAIESHNPMIYPVRYYQAMVSDSK